MQKGKKATTGILGVVLLLAAAWFGIDASSEGASENTTATTTTDTTTAAPKTASTTASTTVAQQDTTSGLPACAMMELPNQADLVVDDILAGGPFDYPKNDGVRFGNYEGILPDESGNYYREYTVETPGLNHRGPLRIVTGGTHQTDPDIWYYTEDHYESFCEITDAES